MNKRCKHVVASVDLWVMIAIAAAIIVVGYWKP
jgi:hypothetical protein